ncbi:MAG: hypothetical protein AAGA67_00575 [Cyanobacteria bacterium P01_F01_bin.153]
MALLLGQDVDLAVVDLPALGLGAEFQFDFPLPPPVSFISVGFGAELEANLDLGFGFDTFGLRQWAEDFDYDPSRIGRIANGLYVSDREEANGTGEDVPELTAQGEVFGTLSFDALLAKAGFRGGLRGQVAADLLDGGEIWQQDDGKVRLVSEIAPRLLRPWELFQFSGRISTFLGVFAEVGVGRAKVEYKRDLAELTLLEFNLGPQGNASGRALDPPVVGGLVFFDANFNRIQDEDEWAFAITDAEGNYTLNVPLNPFDANSDGVIDNEDGQVVIIEGFDSGTLLDQEVPLAGGFGSSVITPLTTLVFGLEVPNINDSAALVRTALGITEDFDFINGEAVEGLVANTPGARSAVLQQALLQNLVIEGVGTLFPGSGDPTVGAIANSIIGALGDRISNGSTVDLTDRDFLQGIFDATISDLQGQFGGYSVDSTAVTNTVNDIASKNSTIASSGGLGSEAFLSLLADTISPPELATGFQGVALRPLNALTRKVVPPVDLAASEAKIEAVLGLPDVDLNNFDPQVEVDNGDASGNGIPIYLRQIQVQTALTQIGRVIKGFRDIGIADSSQIAIDVLIDTLRESSTFNFTDQNQILTVLSKALPEAVRGDSSNLLSQASALIAESGREFESAVSLGGTPASILNNLIDIQGQNAGPLADVLEGLANGSIPLDSLAPPPDGSIGALLDNLGVDRQDGLGLAAQILQRLREVSAAIALDNQFTEIVGTEAADEILAGPGNQRVIGLEQDDTLYGNQGADQILGREGDDLIFGGRGSDLLFGNEQEDTILGNRGDDVLFGGQQNDHLYGNTGDDLLSGDRDDDTLNGGQGNDILLGATGNDLLSGDLGDDTLIGDTGADQFLFFPEGGNDLVVDFSVGEDRLVLQWPEGTQFSSFRITQQDLNAVISNGRWSVTLLNVNAAQITAAELGF